MEKYICQLLKIYLITPGFSSKWSLLNIFPYSLGHTYHYADYVYGNDGEIYQYIGNTDWVSSSDSTSTTHSITSSTATPPATMPSSTDSTMTTINHGLKPLDSSWISISSSAFRIDYDYSSGEVVYVSGSHTQNGIASLAFYLASSNASSNYPRITSRWQLTNQSSHLTGIKSSDDSEDGLSIIRYVSLSNKEKAVKIRNEDNSPIPQWYVDQLIIDHGFQI